jgi:cellulose 1,4-beta-cellobiosidase
MRGRSLTAAVLSAAGVLLMTASGAGAGWTAGASAGPQTVASATLAAPGAPTASVTCVAGSSISVALSWPSVASATEYDVRRGTSSAGPYSLVGSSSTTSYVDTTVSQQTTYHYVVVAKRSAWASAASSQTSAATPKLSNCK